MRHRRMYYATGTPGWMRFGYSPGWIGRSPSGLGPCAEYLRTGVWPTPAGVGSAQAPGTPPWGTGDVPDELDVLKAQAQNLSSQLEFITRRIEEIETQRKGE